MLCYGREICKSPPLIHCFAPLLHNDAMFYSTATFTDSAAPHWANQPDQSLFCVWKIGTSQFPRNEPMMVRSNISNFSRTAPISSCPICSTWKRGHKDPGLHFIGQRHEITCWQVSWEVRSKTLLCATRRLFFPFSHAPLLLLLDSYRRVLPNIIK